MSGPLDWLDVRRGEWRPFLLSFLGAFLVLSFVVLTRSLREAYFLATWEIVRLPWMVVAVVAGSVPAATLFSRLLESRQPASLLIRLSLLLAAGLVGLLALPQAGRTAILAFYLWTAVGCLLLTSGFWTVVSEVFPLRDAKRLFALIGAGGTIGAMLTGLSLSWLTRWLDEQWLQVAGAALLLVFAAVVDALRRAGRARPLPPAETAARDEARRSRSPLLNQLRLVWGEQHLRTIAGLVFIATLMTLLVDFQFKDLARATHADGAALTAFFGAFYGWAGFVALLLQVLVASRLLERIGLAQLLAITPGLILVGAVGVAAAPALWLATLVRGTDYSLRKALFRPAVEILYVPVPQRLRRSTKVVIDTLIDHLAEGTGAALILLWTSLLGLPMRTLVAPIVLAGLAFLLVIRKIDRSYYRSVTERLREAEGRARSEEHALPARDLLSATFTSLDLSGLGELVAESAPAPPVAAAAPTAPDDPLAPFLSPDDDRVLAAIGRLDPRRDQDRRVIQLILARDELFRRTVRLLGRVPEAAAPLLVDLLQDPETDFVVRRRIPEVLAHIGGPAADDALLDLLDDRRFEVRYRAAMALVTRRRAGLPQSQRDWRTLVWLAITLEVRKDRPLWELQKLLDDFETEQDDLISLRVGVRGELSLEHTFRLLSLVLDPEQVRAAYLGVVLDDPELKSFALEYLEHVLPGSVRRRLWVFIGDVSERRKQGELRPMQDVVADMMATGVTLFQGDLTRLNLQKMLQQREQEGESR